MYWWTQSAVILALLAALKLVVGQCPWPRTPHHASLHSDCVCGYSNVRRLSVQCSPVANFSQLLEVLHSPSVQRLPIDLLYINNATGLSLLPRNAFKNLDIQQIHLANTRVETIERGAFAGLEDKLLSLTLQSTGLREIPEAEFRTLRALRTLDLSQNRIRRVRADAFSELGQLATLRLAFNPDMQLDRDALAGLERSLKNLNLKAIGATQIPAAIHNLTELAFLDLAQNKVEDIQPRVFANLDSLTALSLERNLIRSLHPDTFLGLGDSLSSLSLLNNHLVDFPQSALAKLTGLRVLDLGFNAIRQLPSNAFQANSLLTLLALDGNPLKTLSQQAFQHLNSTLRGISVGGKAFECDCKVRWLAEWALEYNLQITSRERNPQFCAKPAHLRSKPFTHVDMSDFVCAPSVQLIPTLPPNQHIPVSSLTSPVPTTPTPTTSTITTTTTTAMEHFPNVHYEHSTTTTSAVPSIPSTSTNPSVVHLPATSYVQLIPVDEPSQGIRTRPITVTSTNSSTGLESAESKTSSKAPTLSHTTLVLHEPNEPQNSESESTPKSTSSKPRHRPTNSNRSHNPQGSLRLFDAIYRNNTIWLRWEPVSKASNTGYQVVYRYFGSKEFHKSEQIGPKQTSYSLSQFIAPNELIVICVINLDEANESLEKEGSPIPTGQCRELTTREPSVKKPNRPPNSSSVNNTSLSSLYPSLKRLNDIDKVVIAISAAVCLFIIVAVLVFSCCFYRSVSRESPLRTVLATTNAKCLSTKSLSPITKSSLDHDGWDAVSVYSTRSIPRARIATHLRPPPIPPPTITGTIRSHISAVQNHATNAPMNRYFGSTLPSKSANNVWLESYLQPYPSVNHLPQVSYGTTVTATGGLAASGGHPGSYMFADVGGNYRDRARLHEKSSSSSSSNNNHPSRQHRNRNRNKSRAKNSSSIAELRIHGGGVGGGVGGGAGSGSSSYNRLLLSSSSNSFQSQNDYDSDHWNGSPGNNGAGGGGQYAGGPRVVSRMNDNEVDIYVDQNYARRFI